MFETMQVICEDSVEREFTPSATPSLRTPGFVRVNGADVGGSVSMAHDGRLKFWAADYRAFRRLVDPPKKRNDWPSCGGA
jgi:hypothetical protein